jgi:hypothetical protein
LQQAQYASDNPLLSKACQSRKMFKYVIDIPSGGALPEAPSEEPLPGLPVGVPAVLNIPESDTKKETAKMTIN